MNKKILGLMVLMLPLTSCNNNSSADLTILTPSGAPALAFYNHYNNQNYVTNSDAQNIISSMTKNGSDIVVVDTISGMDAINNGSPYKLAANLTFGNFYIASTGHDDNNTMDKDDVIISFSNTKTPKAIFEYIYGSDYNVTYVANPQQAAKCLQSKKTLDNLTDVDYVFIAEPVLTQSLSLNQDASIYANIQELYQEKSGQNMIQAGLFVKNGTDKKSVSDFLSTLNNDVDALIADSEILTSIFENVSNEDFQSKYGVGLPMAKKTIKNNNSIGLGFKYAVDNVDNIKSFCNLFNVSVDDENIYQK